MKIRVYYEDTDAGGIVYHTNYIKYCERARSEYFFSQGIVPGDGDESGFVVRRLISDYLQTSTLGDLLTVKTHLLDMKRSSVLLRQTVFREDQLIFRMDITLVYTNNKKPERIPEYFRTLLKKIERINE